MVELLRTAISSKLNDSDDFKRLILRSNDGASEVYLRRDTCGKIICQLDGVETLISEDKIFDSIEGFIQNGFRSLTCENYSGDVHIEIPSEEHGKLKITYSQPFPTQNESGLIDHEEAYKLLEAIEMATADGTIRADMRRKYVQIDSFIKLVQPLLSKSSQKGKVFILDCGAGKSYLSYVMNYFLREKLRRNCHFFCIDTNPDLVDKCLRIQKVLGYENMEFHVSKIKDFQPDKKINIVCSLHACDTATDEAIARGIQLEAPFLLLVPCCQHEVINQLKDHPLKAITRHGLYKAKLADLLTDVMRTLILESAGYKVSVTEYVSPIYTPKNIMIQAEKIQSRNKMAMEQYLELKAMFSIVSFELEEMLPELFPHKSL